MKILKFTPEYEAKLDRKIRECTSASLMSNTKWRKVFSLLSEYSISFTVSWVHDTRWDSTALQPPVPESRIEENGIADPGIGGPCQFKEILALRVPTHRQFVDYRVAQRLDTLQSQLELIGRFPLVRTPDYLEIKGYTEKDGEQSSRHVRK